MSYQAVIEIKNPNQLKLLKAEFKDLVTERFQAKIEENKIKVNADDAVALKAALNSIANTLTVFEKMEKLK